MELITYVNCEGKTFNIAAMKSHNKNTHWKYKFECNECHNVFETECSKIQHFGVHSVAERHKKVGRHAAEEAKKKQ